MRSKYKFIFASLIFLCLVVSMGAASADDLDTIQEGEVSGGVDVAYSNPGVENGELSYDIPEDVQNVQYAGLFVDCYTAGSSNTVYGSEANVSVTSNGETEQIANEMLVSTQGSQDGTVYTINDHTTKCYADYYMTYNLTEMLQGASGKVTINVKTGALEGYEYYNKIKLIGLVFAYDDGDSDKICYWVNSGSSWIKGDSTDTSKATFDVGTIGCEISKATLDNFALSSIDGLYSFNGKELEESTAYDEGVYYFKYHQWDVLDKISNSTNTLVYTPGAGAFSFRNTLSLLTVTKHTPAVSVKLGSEYSGAVFAGTNNVLKLDLTNKGESDTVYMVDFYVDGVKVSSTEIQLNEGLSSSTYLVDDFIRPVTAETVNGVSTTKVNYTVIVSDKDTGEILNESTITPTLWYNGNLGKDLAYPAENITSFNNITVNGDIIIDTKTDSTYMGATATNRTDVWNLDVPDDAQFVNGFIYVSYNWDKSGQTVPPFTAIFNGVAVTPVATYRDQSNMGNYGKYGYGLIVYDVSGLLVKGENTFVLEKEFNKTAVYPSTLVALYNVSNSAIEKTIYMYNGADLLSNANNFLGRIVASNNVLDIDSIENIVGSSLYVFAASAQAGEGNLIVNDASYANVWSGSSNSVGQYIVDLGTAPSESNTVSFVATGSTILALEQFIVVEYNVPSASIKIASEYNGACFAGTDNVIQVNLTNDGQLSTTYTVDLYVDGVKVNSTEVQLDPAAKTTAYLVDGLIRPVTEDTVNGVSTTKVNYTVIVSDENGNVLAESTLTPTVWYNGNLGKDLAYPAENITSFNNITVNGDIIIETKGDSTYMNAAATTRTDVWTLDVPEDAQFVNGFIYVSYNWDKSGQTVPPFTATFNGVAVTPVATYRDQSNMGNYGKYGYGLIVYDVSGLLVKGENTFVLEKESNKTAVYPSTLVALYNVPQSETVKTIYMYNGADLLSNANNFLGRVVASNNVLGIDSIENIVGSSLYVFAASAQSGEGNLIVNDLTYFDVWTGSSNSVGQYIADLGTAPSESNAVSFVATGSTILALQQFIIVESTNPSVSAKIASEYNGACFAGTDNVIQVNLTNDGQASTTYIVDLYVDGVKVNSTEVQLNPEAKTTVNLVDGLIRPVTEDTVNGVSTTKVNYTLVVSDKSLGLVLAESTLTPTVWYNGNLGKDLAYPAENITSFNNITVNGDIIIETKGDSTYMNAAATNRTDVWNLDVPDDAQFVNGFIYVSYNWDKSGQTVPPFTAIFNGVAVTPVATYRDQSNMGNYGKYGYGLIVYDVSGLLVKGENTFVLEKESNKTAVYPSTLVALYNVPQSETVKTIYMYNGADLLSNANNFLGRVVASNNVLGIDSIENAISSSLYVFAASAQAGEGNLIVNDASYDNVWSGSSNSVGQYIVDLGTAPSESNTVSFVATGSTILALQQFIVVESATPKASDLQKLIDETPAGGVLDLGSKVFADVSDINITKDISIVGDNAFIITAGDGKPVFNIASDVNNVSISGLNFVANNGDVLIKATATNGTDDLSINNPAISIANNTVTKANDNVVASSITLFELESERGVLAPSNPIDIKDNNVVDGAKTFDFEIAGLNDGSGINIPQGGSINTNGTSSVKVATTIVAKAMTTTTVNTKINGKNAGKNFAITLKDSNGNVLANKQVMISLDGKIYKCATNANGVATVKIALSKKGTYPVVVSFLGDDKYNGSFAVAKVKVNPQKVKLTVTKKTYKASKKTKYLYATLKATNKKAIKGKKLVFTVNGKKYTAKTNAKGIAKVKVKLSKKKTYKVTVKFAGDNTFKKITKKGKVVIK